MKKIVALALSLVMVLGLATTAFAATATLELYQATEDKTTPWTLVDSWGCELKDTVYGDEVGENSLPYYKLGANDEYAFVECTAAEATHKFVYGATVTYVKAATPAKLAYMAKVSAVTVTDEDVCGMVKVAEADAEKVFYASYDKKGVMTELYVADKTAQTNVLVDGKLVAAVAYNGETVVDHSWVGNDVANNVYTTVKCEYCEKVAALYANATAAGKKSVNVPGFGWITEAAAGYTAAGSVAADATVESAKTFDAGIAMYVGMSVMAAAGSAVVLKKKD